jgi:hypothetical protein
MVFTLVFLCIVEKDTKNKKEMNRQYSVVDDEAYGV